MRNNGRQPYDGQQYIDSLAKESRSDSSNALDTAVQYIDSHLTEDLDIDALAEAFFISKYHMMRLFRQETGFTIHTYLSQRRLLNARGLIEGGMRATEACYRSGFRSYSSFTRAYGKHFGTTPTGRMDTTQEREESYE